MQVSVCAFLSTYAGVILIDDAIPANQCLVLAEVKWCQVEISVVSFIGLHATQTHLEGGNYCADTLLI